MKNNRLSILTLIGALFLFNLTVMAQKKKKYKEINIIKASDTINVSADSLWNIVKKFDNVGVYFSGIDHAVGKGEPEFEGATCSERTCYVNLKGYSEIHEKLTLFDEEKRELAYELTSGAPSFMIFAGNHWTIKEISPNQCTLKMHASIRMKRFMGFLFGGKLKRTIEKQLPEALQELKVYAETGDVSQAKKERMVKLKKKNIF
ncbi:SRPBCC family protein [Flavivirga algicola]|uniref:SRPBCC family protein n=1 Tax=Flavivirga algicola TaxID=2729136 RepID=A0ABX1RT13_9FLAO|nr:SRPBCC family protein [Flavivirga algicola]NMH85918.1 SRPBCC family protein [Flavivirga algicola]